jgi:hypothetical protein
MKDTSKEIGFGAVGVVVAALAVILIGAIAWRVYNASQTHSPARDENAKQSSKAASTTQQTNAADYLEVKELGVKIKLDEKTKDITYVDSMQSPGDESVYIIDLSMKAMDEKDQYCKGPTAGMVGLLDRSKDVNHWGEMPLQVDNNKSFKIGDYYYLFRGPQSECSQDTQVSRQRASREQDFITVLKTIQAN